MPLPSPSQKYKILDLGHYQTAEGHIAIVTRLDATRAYGHMIDSRDTTWWYADSGQHGLYPDDDLIKRLDFMS